MHGDLTSLLHSLLARRTSRFATFPLRCVHTARTLAKIKIVSFAVGLVFWLGFGVVDLVFEIFLLFSPRIIYCQIDDCHPYPLCPMLNDTLHLKSKVFGSTYERCSARTSSVTFFLFSFSIPQIAFAFDGEQGSDAKERLASVSEVLSDCSLNWRESYYATR